MGSKIESMPGDEQPFVLALVLLFFLPPTSLMDRRPHALRIGIGPGATVPGFFIV